MMLAVAGHDTEDGRTVANNEKRNSQARRLAMYVVLAVWTMSFIADIYMNDYQPSPFIHMAMMTILGAIFGREVIGKNGSDE